MRAAGSDLGVPFFNSGSLNVNPRLCQGSVKEQPPTMKRVARGKKNINLRKDCPRPVAILAQVTATHMTAFASMPWQATSRSRTPLPHRRAPWWAPSPDIVESQPPSFRRDGILTRHRELVSMPEAWRLVAEGHRITVEVLSDWAPADAATASSSCDMSSPHFLQVKSGMNVTLKKHSGGWWFGCLRQRQNENTPPTPRRGGVAAGVCFTLWVIHTAFSIDKIDPSADMKSQYLNLSIGDTVVVQDKWDEGTWSGWGRGTKRGSSTSGLFHLSYAVQKVSSTSFGRIL